MLEHLSGETALYPILGDPIRYVKSPQLLTAALHARQHNGICVPMQVAAGELEPVVHTLQLVPNVRGLLITMPHKNTMPAHCGTLSETARLLGAVNIVRRNQDGSWHGDMLDGLAFLATLRKVGAHLEGSRVLQVGAGGAGSAIAIALLSAGIRELVLHDISPARLDPLVRLLVRLDRAPVAAAPADLSGIDPAGFDIAINATPMGLSPDDPLPIPGHLLTPAIFVGDVISGHGVTPLMQAARNAGCKTADGFKMVEAGVEIMPDFLLNS